MVPEIKNILFVTDLSPSARHAFHYAVTLARFQHAGLVVLHVMEATSPSSEGYLKGFIGEERWNQIKAQRETEARQILIGKQREGALIQEALSDFCDDARSELGAVQLPSQEIVVAEGNVVDEILATAEAKSCGVIVMGYHARGKVGEAFLGSTSRRVLRQGRVPVLMVRLPEA